MSRVILHCDMNNFFASVECRLNPELRSKCVAVCGSTEMRHGIVLAKNEKAKKYGVKTGEAIWEAKRKCPALTVVSPHYERYIEYSRAAMEIYSVYTDLIEPFGIDECWLDVTGSTRLFGSGEQIADEIRNTVRERLGVTVSVGVSFNKVFAKLGSDMKKPDAVTVIPENGFREMIYGLSADSIIGVGKSAAANLHRIGVDTIGELASLSEETLKIRMGCHGQAIWRYANGIDLSPVSPIGFRAPIKSIGRGSTTVRDLVTDNEVHDLILAMSDKVARKLRKSALVASAIRITVKTEDLINHDYQSPLPFVTNHAQVIAKHAFALFKLHHDWYKTVRAVTVCAINLMPDSTARQLDMLNDAYRIARAERLDITVDGIIDRFGDGSVIPMTLVGGGLIPKPRPDGINAPGYNISG